MAMNEMVQEKARAAAQELKLKMEKKGLEEEQNNQKYQKYGKKIQKKKMRNKKKRVAIDI